MNIFKMSEGDAAEKRKWQVCFLSAVVIILAIAFVFASGVLNTYKVWPDVELEYQGEKKEYSLDEGDSYGIMTGGPYHDLAAGRYRLQWQIEGDGVNRIHLSCSNGTIIEPAVFETVAEDWQGEVTFEIKDAVHNVSIGVEFASGTWMNIYNLRLYSPEYTDDAWTFALLLIVLWFLFVADYMGWGKENTWQALAAITFAAVVVCVPCFSRDCISSYDTQFHAARIMNLVDGLKNGQLHVRVGGFSYNGYGAATSVFYPDLLLYPMALMVIGGASINYVIQLNCLVISILSGWLMYIAAKRILGNASAACYAAILYVCSIFRLEDMYVRYMLGQMIATSVLPVFMLGLWEVIQGDSKRWYILTLGATLVFQSHMCTTLLCAFFAVSVCLICARRILRDRTRIYAIVLAAVTTLLLNFGTLIPFADLYLGGVNTPTTYFSLVDSAYPLKKLIVLDGPRMGLVMWPVIFVAIGALILEKNETLRHRVLLFLCMGCVFALMSTKLFPWQAAVDMTNGVIEVIQFPWRFLVLSTAFISVCGGYGIAKLLPGLKKTAVMITLILCIASSWPYLQIVMRSENRIPFGNGANPYMLVEEYQYEGSDLENTRSKKVILSDGIQMTNYEKNGTRVKTEIDAQQDGTITFPMFGFDGYEVSLNGEKMAWKRAENNCLSVDVRAGMNGVLQIRYVGKMIWKVADCISMMTAAVLIWHRLRGRKKLQTVCR